VDSSGAVEMELGAGAKAEAGGHWWSSWSWWRGVAVEWPK